MNVDDVEFLFTLIEDFEQTYFGSDPVMISKIARARTLLAKYVYRTKEDKLANPRQEELNFNDYRDWHSDPNWSDENDDED